MENIVNTHDVIMAATHDMANANSELRGDSPDKFNRFVLKLIQQEIAVGKASASHWKYIDPAAHTYTHTGNFPFEVFQNLSEDFLNQLETADIHIYKDSLPGKATIKIIFRF